MVVQEMLYVLEKCITLRRGEGRRGWADTASPVELDDSDLTLASGCTSTFLMLSIGEAWKNIKFR